MWNGQIGKACESSKPRRCRCAMVTTCVVIPAGGFTVLVPSGKKAPRKDGKLLMECVKQLMEGDERVEIPEDIKGGYQGKNPPGQHGLKALALRRLFNERIGKERDTQHKADCPAELRAC